jgi:hypothetical protein
MGRKLESLVKQALRCPNKRQRVQVLVATTRQSYIVKCMGVISILALAFIEI